MLGLTEKCEHTLNFYHGAMVMPNNNNIDEKNKFLGKIDNTSIFKVTQSIKNIIQPPKFHAFCIGTAKSGTHSLADMLSAKYRASHEPNAVDLITLKNLALKKQINNTEIVDYIRFRHKQMRLELESSDFCGYFIKEYVETFPKSKFILTVREPFSFLESIINHQLNTPAEKPSLRKWVLGREINYNYENNLTFSENDQVLEEYDCLYPIKGYLDYWFKRNNEAITLIPEDRLLILNTFKLKQNSKAIADFLCVPENTIKSEHSHSFKSPKKWDLLSKIDSNYIDELMESTGCLKLSKKLNLS